MRNYVSNRKDRYGQSWQIVPTIIPELFKDHESATAQRALEAMLKMKNSTSRSSSARLVKNARLTPDVTIP